MATTSSTMAAMTTATRNPELPVSEGRVRKSRAVDGRGWVLLSGRSFLGRSFSGRSFLGRSVGAGGGLCVVGVVESIKFELVFAFQISFDSLFGISDGARQF